MVEIDRAVVPPLKSLSYGKPYKAKPASTQDWNVSISVRLDKASLNSPLILLAHMQGKF